MPALSRLEEAIPALRRYAWSLLRQPHDADDLVQECLLRALDHMDSRRDEDDIRPWLFAIMHNLHVSHWRRMRRRPQVALEDADTALATDPAQPSQIELQDALRCLSKLPEEQRQVLLLVSVEGLEYAAVARMLDVPIGTVMSRLSRARDRLRDLMAGRDRPQLRRVK